MVSEITFFENHFHDSQFGPASIETGQEDDGERLPEDEPGLKSTAVTFLQGATVFVLLFVVLWVVLSRLLSEDEGDSE